MNKNEKRLNIRMLQILVVCSPIFIAFLLVSIQAIFQNSFRLPIPAWNDEAAYYSLVKTWLQTGQPIGYWGFNGGHAILGTGSGWSFAILFPYAMFGRIFTWNYSSVFLANVVFLCIAQGLFLYLVKPKKEKLIRILILEFTSIITILYMTTSMSEPLRYGLAIILAGMFYRLYAMEVSKGFRYIILPLYIIAITQVYIFLVFCVPIYIFGILRKKSFWKRILFSLVSMITVVGGSYYLLHLISSNYNIYKTERLFECIKRLDFWGALVEFVKNLKDGIVSLLSICNRYVGHGMFVWFVPLCILFIIIPFGLWLKKRKDPKNNKKTDDILLLIVAYSVGLFLFMYITVYSLERFTFFRGVGIVVLFAMYLLVLLEDKKIYLFFAILYGVGIVFLPMNVKDFNIERYPSKEVLFEWNILEQELNEVLVLKDSENAWDNTVAVYTLEPRVLVSIPEGFGINMMMDASIFATEADYILIPIKEKQDLRRDWLEADTKEFMLEFEEYFISYQIIYEDKGIRIYQKLNYKNN